MTADNNESERYNLHGAIFQIAMASLWVYRCTYRPDIISWFDANFNFDFRFHSENLTISFIIGWIGVAIMVYSMFAIYIVHQRPTNRYLITRDIFSLTRHPMYHGMFLADLMLFWATDLTNIWFWLTWFAFTGCMLMAGWYQEKETLARWGVEADLYYATTPRFIWDWVWFRKIIPNR